MICPSYRVENTPFITENTVTAQGVWGWLELGLSGKQGAGGSGERAAPASVFGAPAEGSPGSGDR